MGNLPEARVNSTRPFYHTGVDYTGYVDVKSSKGRGIKTSKGYIAVFICMVTKAVHLELVSDLTSSAFLAALRRMAARRGPPGHMYSDNGTNFVGANNTLQKEFIDLTAVINQDFLTEISMMNIEWHFNAPTWASAGGLWEAAVKSLKYHLKRVIGDQKLTFEEFSTLLAQLEACLNTRPLCTLTEDPDDLDYLTPSHFLASGPVLNIIETERDERTRWRLTQKIFEDVWKRWKSEYLTQLTARSKWRKQQANMNLGDVVLIHDANLPAGKWAIGKVVELHPGADNFVRVVSIKTKNGIIKRPITKLSLLLNNEESNNQDQQKYRSIDESPSLQTAEQKPKRSIKKRTVNLYTLVLMLISFLVTTANASYNITSLKSNQSLYFDKISNMYLVRDDWKLIVYYNMEPYWQNTELFIKYVNHLDSICSRTKRATQCDVILLQLRHNYVELQYYNDMLLGQRFGAHARLRRGLINGVGYVANSLFGILDESFAEQYKKDIELIRENQKHIARLWRNQTSLVEAEHNLLKRVENNIEKQHKIFNQHLNRLEITSNTLRQEIQGEINTNEFAMSALIANGLIVHLKNIQDSLLDTITDVYQGKFDIHLITPNQLRQELSIISGQLSKELALPINNIHTDLTKIYHLLKVKARVTKDYLIFEIKIPLVSRESYEIYKIIPLPKQQGNEMISIIPISDHLAINIQRDTYLPMSKNDVHSCVPMDENTCLCTLTTPVFQMKSDSNLCIKDSSDQCQYQKGICTNIWEQLITTNTYLFVCCDKCTLRFVCGYQVTTEQVTKAGIISLGTDCLIKGDTFTVYSHKQKFNEIHTQSDIVKVEIPPINNVINLSIPVINISNEEFNFNNSQIELKQIDDQIHQMKEQSGQIDSISYHDVHHYVAIYSILIGAVVAGLTYALWRMRRSRRRRSVRAVVAPAAPAPAPAPAARVLRADVIDSVSARLQCGSDKAEQPNVKRVSESENQCASVNELTKGARVRDKATSPIFTKFDFDEK